MSNSVGRICRVKVDDTVISDLSSFSVNSESPSLKAAVYGGEYEKVFGMGIKSWSGECSGYLNIGDTGQDAIYNAHVNSTLVSGIEFVVDNTNNHYWAPDTATDPDAGVYITTYNTSSTAEGITEISITFEGSGPTHRVTT